MKTIIKSAIGNMLARFRKEDGAVSVDWVVLTAGIVGVAAGAGLSIKEATSTLSASVGTEIQTKTVENGD